MVSKSLIGLGQRHMFELVREVSNIIKALDLKQFDSNINLVIFGEDENDLWGCRVTYLKKENEEKAKYWDPYHWAYYNSPEDFIYVYAVETLLEISSELKKVGVTKLEVQL